MCAIKPKKKRKTNCPEIQAMKVRNLILKVGASIGPSP